MRFGNRLRLRWLVANLLAFALSQAVFGLADVLVDVVGAHGKTAVGIGAHLVALALGGVVVGWSQWRAVRALLTGAGQWGPVTWTAATGVAYVMAFFFGETVGGLPLGLLLSYTLFGAVSGVLQSRLGSPAGFSKARWALGSCLGFAGGGVVATGLVLAAFAVGGPAIITRVPAPVALAVVGSVGGGLGAALMLAL